MDAGTKDSTSAGPTGALSQAPKRLYRIYENAMFRGVCAGLAAYFNLDATLVRAIFIALTLVTGGGFYPCLLRFNDRDARCPTADQMAQAHGEPPFTAQDFIDRAKLEYHKFADDPTVSKDEWRQKMREWKTRCTPRSMRGKTSGAPAARASRAVANERHGNGIAAAVAGIILTVLWIIFLVAVWSFLAHGMVFGHVIGAGHPLWMTLLFMALIFWLITLPFQWHGGWCGHGHHHHGGGIWSLLGLILLFYVASLLFPQVHAAWEHVITYLQTVR